MPLPEHLKLETERLEGAHPAFRECTRQLLEFLDKKIPGVFADCCDRLFELAADSRSDVEQSRYFEGRREIEVRKNRLCRAFIERVDAGLANFYRRRRAPSGDEKPAEERGELRVLDDRDLTVTLAVDTMVDRAEIRFTRDLYALGVRLGALLETPPLGNDVNPAAPRALCEAFRDTLVTVEAEIEVHQALFKSFEQGVVRALGDTYALLSESLARAGIVPDLRLAGQTKVEPETPEEQPQSPDPEELAEASLERRSRDAAQALEQKIMTQVQSLLARRRDRLWSSPSTPPVPTQALRDVLSSLQTELAAGGVDARLSAAAIKSQLLESGGESGPCSLSPRDEDTVDLLGMMFEFVASDRQLPEPFQAALQRLQIPYLRAALRDSDEVISPASPARRLLEELSQAARGWSMQTDRDGELLAKVNEIVDRVTRRFWDDQRVLESLLEEVRDFRQERERLAERRAQRLAQSVHGSEQLSFARHNVAQLLHRRLQNRSLPTLVHDLLERAWSHVMVLTVLRHGLQSAQWKEALATADELIWSVTFERSDQAVKRLRTRMPVIANTIAKGLRSIGYQDAEIEKILVNLRKLHAALMSQSGSDRVLVEIDAAGITISGESLLDPELLEQTEELDNEEELGEVLDAVRAWHAGKWVIFRDQGEELRAKLSWISPLTGRYLFVDQRGLRAAEKSPAELARDLVGHKLEPLDDAGIITRALGGVADRLRHDMASATIH